MDMNISRGTAETANLAGSIAQSNRFKDRNARKADSVVQNEVVYFSPVIRIDPDTQIVMIQYRDSNTGTVKNEYSTERQIESYEKSSHVTDNLEVAAVEVKEVKPQKKEGPVLERVDQDA